MIDLYYITVMTFKYVTNAILDFGERRGVGFILSHFLIDFSRHVFAKHRSDFTKRAETEFSLRLSQWLRSKF